MDSLTQICLGAAVGEATLGKKIGNHAILWGAVLGTLPDLDVLFKPFFGYVDGLVMHRGLSHSILFFIITSPLFGWLIQKLYSRNTTVKEWTIFSFLVMFTHAILDSFTSWGTQLFWPHPMRVAWNNIFVADLFYTIPLLVCLIWLMFKNRNNPARSKLNYWGLILSSAYMLVTIVNKQVANNVFVESLENQSITYSDYSSRPTPLNSILWDAVVVGKDEYYMGYYSLLKETRDVEFRSIPKNHELMDFANGQSDWEKLKVFTDGNYSVEKGNADTLKVHDLRFGQMQFPDGTSDWVFTFYAIPDENNRAVFSQKELPSEKFETGDLKKAFGVLWQGILGHDLASKPEPS